MSMVHAIRFKKAGGPEVLSWQEVEVGKPGQGQVRLRTPRSGSTISTFTAQRALPMPMPSGLGSRGPEWSRRSDRGSAG